MNIRSRLTLLLPYIHQHHYEMFAGVSVCGSCGTNIETTTIKSIFIENYLINLAILAEIFSADG